MKILSLFLLTLLSVWNVTAQSFAIDSMKRILHAAPTIDTQLVRITLQLSSEWTKYNADSALAYAEKAYQMASTLKYVAGIAESRVAQAKIYMAQGEFARGYELYQEALHKYIIANDHAGMAIVHNGLGKAFVMQDNYTKALQYYERSVKENELVDAKLALAETFLRMGEIHSKTRQYDKALQSYEKGLQLAEAVADRNTRIDAFLHVGATLYQMKQYRNALFAFTRAKNLALISGSIPAIAESNVSLGYVYTDMAAYDSAHLSFSKALNYFNQLKYKDKIAATYKGIGTAYFKQKQYAVAKEYINLSNETAAQTGNNTIRYENYNLLVDISIAEGDFVVASNYFGTILKLKDSLYNADKLSSIEKLRSNHELEKKQATIEALQKDKRVITSQRNYLMLACGVVVLCVVSLGYTIVQVKGKTKLLQAQKKTLEQQKKELEDLNLVKDKYFSVLSHDLRSPMGNILGLLNLITEDGILTEQEKKQFFNRLKLSTASALETMDNMLAWGKYQIKENKNEIKDVNIQEVTDRVCRFLSQSADNKSIRIVNHIHPSLNIMADKNRFEFVVRNLMSNALKFSHKNSKIEIWTSYDDEYVNIHVKDFGTGMKKETTEKISRGNTHESTKGTAGEIGSGLGLVLCKEFITSHQGKLTVESEEGIETVFTVSMPRHHAMAEHAMA